MNKKILLMSVLVFAAVPSYLFAGVSPEKHPTVIAFEISKDGSTGPKEIKMLAELVTLSFLHEKDFVVLDKNDVIKAVPQKLGDLVGKTTDVSMLNKIGSSLGIKFSIHWIVEGNKVSFVCFDLKKQKQLSVKSGLVKGSKEEMVSFLYALLQDLFDSVEKKLVVEHDVAPPVIAQPVVTPPAVTQPAIVQKPVVKQEPVKQEPVVNSTPVREPPPKNLVKPAKADVPINPYKVSKHVTLWTGVALCGTAGGLFYLAGVYHDEYRSGNNDMLEKRNLVNDLSISFMVIGGALIVTGVTLFFLDPGDAEWAKKHKIAMAPVVDDRIAGLVLSGSW